MNDLYCPYCDEDLGSHVDDCHSQDVQYEHQCPKCDKNFVFTIEYYPSFTSNKADCLNGKEHKFEQITGVPKELFKDKYRCKDCSEMKIIKNKEDASGR